MHYYILISSSRTLISTELMIMVRNVKAMNTYKEINR